MTDTTLSASAPKIKRCTVCLKEKPATTEFFSTQPRGRYGLHSHCKRCSSERQAARYHADPEKGRQIAAKYRAVNASKVRQNEKRVLDKHRAANAVAVRVFAEAVKKCPSCGEEKPLTAEFFSRLRSRKSGYHPNCKVCSRARTQTWRASNRDVMRLSDAKQKAKRKTDICKRLNVNMGNAMRDSIRGGKAGRGWQEIAGYTIEELRTHLERQFVKGMSWSNYGSRWHVDHILAQSSFSFETTDCPDFKACWAISNLRPLWKEENLSKNDKRLFLI